jgi:4'-phosphopantetheinyl transferase
MPKPTIDANPAPALSSSSATIWWASIAPESVAEAKAWRCLDDSERQRARRFHSTLDQAHWMRSRYFLRAVLGAELGIPPEAVRFDASHQGKPCLALRDTKLHFNLAHSGPWAAVALSDQRVGVDLEVLSRDASLLDVAADVLTPNEMNVMHALPAADRLRFFHALWTAKEALMKATGDGLGLPPRQIDIDVADHFLPSRYLSHPGWWLRTMWIKDDLVMSVSGPGIATSATPGNGANEVRAERYLL